MTFVPGAAQTPGRLNLFQFKKFQVVVDYAQTRMASKQGSSQTPTVRRWALCGRGRSSRRGHRELGPPQRADVRRDDHPPGQFNLRGKTDDETIALMVKGIMEVDPNKKYIIIKKEDEAIRHAISTAKPWSFLTLCSDVVPDALALVPS